MENAKLEAAEMWAARGQAPIPIVAGTKKPAIPWQPFQQHIPGEGMLRAWFDRDEFELAIVCGGRLAVIDCDTEYSYNDLVARHPKLYNTYTVKTARGAHIYLNVNDKTRTRLHVGPGIDIKADRGYVLTAPSRHPSGQLYKVQRDVQIATVDSLTEIIPEIAEVVPETKERGLVCTGDVVQASIVKKIKERVKILDALLNFTDVFKSSPSGQYWMARCPSPHHGGPDHNPSMWVDTATNRCSCYKSSCRAMQPKGRAMDVIDLWATIYGYDVHEAIRRLALLTS